MKTPPITSLFTVRSLTAAASFLAPAAARADLVAWWSFDSPPSGGVVTDSRAGLPGQLLAGAAITDPSQGRSGTASDRASRFGVGNQRIYVGNAGYFTDAAASNILSVSFWIRQNAIRNATPLSFVSPAASGGRGFQAHVPWSNNTIYFDTGGCCTNDVNRVFAGFSTDWTQWRHVALIKNGDSKLVYIDGGLLVSGISTAPINSAITELFIGNSPTTTEAVNGDIDDFAVFSHALSDTDVAQLSTGAPPDSLPGVNPNDTDGDGLPDLWELRFYPSLTELTSPTTDRDSDGLNNGSELALGTNPANSDSDADGATDGSETNTGIWVSTANRGTSPINPDTDADGLRDGAESNTGTFVSPTNTGSNPLLTDSDTDLVRDGDEVAYGSNPVNAASTPVQPGVPTLLAWWQFNDNSSPTIARDSRAGHAGTLTTNAAYSPDAEGASSTPGDRALRISAAGGKLRLDNAPWLNMATRIDKLTVSFWQKRVNIANSSSFWFVSTAAGAGSAFRGFQAHCPYSNNIIYFDSAGCCAANQRINAAITTVDWTQWHHFVFLKDGPSKRVYIDGAISLSGTGSLPLPTDFSALNIGADNGAGSINGWIDDFSIFAAALNDQDITSLATRTKSPAEISTSSDADADGLVDAWEFLYFPGDLTKLSATGDFDRDSSTDSQELARSTDPTNPDSDGDSLTDGSETNTGIWISPANTGTNPKKADSDGDGFTDNVESASGTYVSQENPGTDPNKPDSDGDSFLDSHEGLYLANPNLASSVPFDRSKPFLLAHWAFDDASAPDQSLDAVRGFRGTVTGTFSAPGGGRSGLPSDSSICLTGGQSVTANADFTNLATSADRITISFWQKLDFVTSSSAFWLTSPGSDGGRGMQAHVPWGDNNIYFDHSGCCAGGATRISGPLPAIDVTAWHHFAFVKDGPSKIVYLDGSPALTGAGTEKLRSDHTILTLGGGPAGYMSGCLDDFALYAGALDPALITRLAAGASPSSILQPPSADFRITAYRLNPDGTFHLEWNTTPGLTYVVEASPNPLSPTWTAVSGTILAGTSSASADVSLPPGPSMFLRVRQ